MFLKLLEILGKKNTNNFNRLYGQEKNYTKFFFKKYKRHFDFYWNKPTHKKTRELSLQLHILRNLLNNLNHYLNQVIQMVFYYH